MIMQGSQQHDYARQLTGLEGKTIRDPTRGQPKVSRKLDHPN